MKNSWHQIVNSILILLVGIYCVFSFNSKENKPEEKLNTSQEMDLNRNQLDPTKNSTLDGASKIAFVNSDTLKKYYLYYDKFQKNMFNKEEAAKKVKEMLHTSVLSVDYVHVIRNESIKKQ